MKYLLLVSMLITTSYALDSYLICQDKNGEIIETKQINTFSKNNTVIEFNDMMSDRYSFEIIFDHSSNKMSANTYEMNSGLLMGSYIQDIKSNSKMSLVSGYTCQVID